MDVAFFTESYPPTHDGVATVVSGLARALHRAGHGVRVFAPHPVKGAPPFTEEIGGIPVVRVRSLPVPVYGEYRWGFFPFAQLRGQHLQDVDVIHVHTPGMLGNAGFLASRYFEKPLVGTFHTNVWEMRKSFRPRALAAVFFRAAWVWTLGIYWRCDAATAPTDSARAALESAARKPFRTPVEVIPNGIEIERFHPGIATPSWRERCGLPSGPIVTFLGRLTADKGVHRFLDAVERTVAVRDVNAIVAGSGPEADAVAERIRARPALARRTRYVGPVAEEEKASLLAQSDLFVLPSTSDTSSVAVLEAMACGAACLASSVGGPADVVHDWVTGRLVDPLDPAAIARLMGELLDDGAERAALARRALEFVRASASIDATAHRFISLYEHLLAERPPSAARHSF
ncbi:MAG TPA: glycosyltransferase [Thermoplasmata archaeon]|nr:glycosyltransferase [Thermoplasmata archaeon]